jgi:hypothetical protein
MKMSNNEISIMNIYVKRTITKIIPVKPPVIKVDTKPIANNMAGLNCKLPFQSVVIKLKALTRNSNQ